MSTRLLHDFEKCFSGGKIIVYELLDSPTSLCSIKLGSFGMLDIAELDPSLKLKYLGRLLVTSHPVLNRLKMEDFFHPCSHTSLDETCSRAIHLLTMDRQALWPEDNRRGEIRFSKLLKSSKIPTGLSYQK